MREKLLILLKTENLTSSRLAELLGIQPSNISHILSGRNKKPSFDFVQRILRRFPKINPDWLMLDSEQMYRDSATAISGDAPDSSPDAASGFSSSLTFDTSLDDHPTDSAADTPANVGEILTAQNSHIPTNGPMAEKISHSPKAIKRVIILYADRTFESYEG